MTSNRRAKKSAKRTLATAKPAGMPPGGRGDRRPVAGLPLRESFLSNADRGVKDRGAVKQDLAPRRRALQARNVTLPDFGI